MIESLDLRPLLTNPRESLTIEHKSWIDLSKKENAAKLAKAVIALANHGGGFIVFGMRPNSDSDLLSTIRPDLVNRYNQDEINSIINNYCDPKIHCDLFFENHPESLIEHAIVRVPGDLATPVMSKRDVQGHISSQRCYIRKPGPKSEEPFTSEEWRTLINRCIRSNQDSLIDSIRSMLGSNTSQGGVKSLLLEDAHLYLDKCHARWDILRSQLPENNPARFPYGYYEQAYKINHNIGGISLSSIKTMLGEADKIKLTGWGPFVQFRKNNTPKIIDGGIEAWLADMDGSSDGRYSDFWRAELPGLLYQLRSYDEDFHSALTPGNFLDFALPIWRVGETLLFVSRFSRQLSPQAEITAIVRYRNLKGREITSLNWRYHAGDGKSYQDEITSYTSTTAEEIDNNIVGVCKRLLHPVYEIFDFYELTDEVVAHQISRLKGRAGP